MRSAVLIAACIASAAAAQEPPRPPKAEDISAVILAEFLDADVSGSLEAYGQIVETETSDDTGRSVALRRLLEAARVRGDEDAMNRWAEWVHDSQRGRVLELLRDHLGSGLTELNAALRAGNADELAERREEFTTFASRRSRSLRNLPRLRSAEPPESTESVEPSTQTDTEPPTATDGVDGYRLAIPLPSTRLTGSPARSRAAQVARLYLQGETVRAERLEADLVERLRAAGMIELLQPPDTAVRSPEETERRLQAVRKHLVGLLLDTTLTAAEGEVLGMLSERIENLEREGQLDTAARLLELLPYQLP